MTLEQVQFQPLAELVAEKLRQSIISGGLQPGERLIERKLAAALGTSQPTVRAALTDLEYLGFVRKVHNKGTYVTRLTPEDFHKIMEIRMPLEFLAVQKSAANMTPEGAHRLKELVTKMNRAARSEDRAAFHDADVSFHQTIWRVAGNEYLAEALKQIIFSMFAFVLRGQRRKDFLAAVEQHKQILEGVTSGNPRFAGEQFLKSTLRFWKDFHDVHVEVAIPFKEGDKR